MYNRKANERWADSEVASFIVGRAEADREEEAAGVAAEEFEPASERAAAEVEIAAT